MNPPEPGRVEFPSSHELAALPVPRCPTCGGESEYRRQQRASAEVGHYAPCGDRFHDLRSRADYATSRFHEAVARRNAR